MFWKTMLTRTEVHNRRDGSKTKLEVKEFELNTCFGMVRHLLEFESVAPYVMGKLTNASVEITEVYSGCVSYGDYKSSTYTFSGAAADIRPILEYIFYWHYHNSRIEGLDTSVFDASFELIPKDGSRSYLPALLVGNVATHSFNAFDKKILAAFWDINDAVIARYKKTQDRQWRVKDNRLWLDFCEANEMWFNEPSMNFMQLVESLGLLYK